MFTLTSLCGLVATTMLALTPTTVGRPLKVAQETKVSALLGRPEAFRDKEVRVRGTIVQVCQERGCMMVIKGDQRFQTLMVKVEDGALVFPADGTGKEAVVEGILRVKTYSEQELKALCETERKALFGKSWNTPGPKHVVRLEGLGAEIGR